MRLDQLRVFVAVAEREHLTQAAEALNLTQSATSAAIAALENRYATRLFDRIGRRIRLTDAGRIFLDEARAVLARAESAETVLADLAGLKRGKLRLAASQTIGNYWLPPLMLRFRARFPNIELTFRIGNTETVAAWVHDAAVDIGFVEGEIDDPALSVIPVAHDEVVLVVGAEHPWAARRAVNAPELADTRWILREPGSGTRGIFAAALSGRGIRLSQLDILMELPSNEAILRAVETGAGATVISELVASSSLRSGAVVRLDFPLPTRRFLALRHKERHATRAEQAFLAAIGEDGAR